MRTGGALIVVLCFGATAAGQSFVNWESPHVSPLDMTPDGTTLLAVNTADNRLEVFTIGVAGLTHTGSVAVGLDPVSVRARTDTEAWVVNHISDSVSIVDLVAMNVVNTIFPGDEPTDVVFAGVPQRAFVSVSQLNQVRVYDPADPAAAPTVIDIEGEDPRTLATDGTNVYLAIFESGNETTILFHTDVSDPGSPYAGVNPPPNDGVVFLPPLNPVLPPAPAVSIIVKKDEFGVWRDDNGADWSSFVTWDLHDHDVAIIDPASLAVTYATGTMNINMALTAAPGGGVTVVGTDSLNHIRFAPNLFGIFVKVMGAAVSPGGGEPTILLDLNPHLDYTSSSVPQATRDLSIGDPRGIAWRAAGDRAYISGMGSNNLISVDASLSRVGIAEVGEGPTGVVMDDAHNRVYVLNKFEASISTVDPDLLLEIDRVFFHDPTPDAIKSGRPALYDTHVTSGLGQASCASCHVDGRIDQLSWDLGNPAGSEVPFDQTCGVPGACEDWHPLKGPMTTQTFQGIIGTEPLHWRGDKADLPAFNGAFTSIMGDDVVLTPTEMSAFVAFVDSITYPPNPNRSVTNSVPTLMANGGNAVNGQFLFTDINCVTCHSFPAGTNGVIAFQAGLSQPQSIKMPQLRNQYEKTGFDSTSMNNNRGFGFYHDGALPTLMDFIQFAFNNLTPQEELDTEAFMLCFSFDTHGGVGMQTTLPGIENPAATVNHMIAVAGSGVVGLVAKGFVNGEHRGYYLTTGFFQSDRESEFVSTLGLINGAAAGAEVTFTLVPAGTEVRIGVDRDEDGFFDRNELDAGSDPADPKSTPDTVGIGDIDGDGIVGIGDLLILLSAWGPCPGDPDPCPADINGDGVVGISDMLLLLGNWG